MRRIVSKFILAVGFLTALGWLISSMISSRREQQDKERAEQEEKIRVEQAVSRMATKQNAVTDWKEGLGKSFSLYTIDLQRSLVRDDGRPLLFYVSVRDVKEEDGKYLLILDNNSDFRATIRLVLECDPKQAREVLGRGGLGFEDFEDYAVIAQIRSVRKLVDQDLSAQDSESSHPTAITSPIFLAEGRAVDLVFAGVYGLVR